MREVEVERDGDSYRMTLPIAAVEITLQVGAAAGGDLSGTYPNPTVVS